MPPHQSPELMEELVEEVLLRFPPDDPARLVSAALVCKLWCRLVTGTAFHRRFREFHRSRAPLLGVFYNNRPKAYFVPTTSFHFHPAHAAANDGRSGWRAMDARHGRVLLYRPSPWPQRPVFSVWDPVTAEQRDMPKLPFDTRHRYTAAVACTAAAGGNCSHLDCHRGPFLVVAMGIQQRVTNLSVYSSEAGAWSQVAEFERPTIDFVAPFARAPSILVGTALYFLLHCNGEIVRYDLATREVSQIDLPSKFHHLLKQRSIVLIKDDDGGLALGFVDNTEYQLELWSMVTGGDAGFVLTRVIDLVRLLPCRALIDNSQVEVSCPQVSGFVDIGATRFLFIRTSDGLYSIEIDSRQVNKVANCCDDDKVVLPYVSFCTPTSKV